MLASAGDSWYETKMTAEFIVSGTPEVEFSLQPLEPRKKKTVKIPLEGFPKRPGPDDPDRDGIWIYRGRHDDRHDT